MAEPVFTPGQPDHGLPGFGQDHAAAAPAGRSGARRHRGADQRVRRGRARSSSAGAHRRDDGAAAVGLPVLHHPRRAVGGDQGPAFASASAGWCRRFRRLVVESTGLADPFPILSTVQADPVLRHHFRLGNVITTVDAVNGAAQLARQPESVKQVAVADRLVLTKTDLADGRSDRRADRAPAPAQSVGAAVARRRGAARCRGAAVARSVRDGRPQRSRAPLVRGGSDAARRRAWHDRNRHDETIHAFALTFDGPLDWTLFGLWLTMLLNRHGEKRVARKGHPERRGLADAGRRAWRAASRPSARAHGGVARRRSAFAAGLHRRRSGSRPDRTLVAGISAAGRGQRRTGFRSNRPGVNSADRYRVVRPSIRRLCRLCRDSVQGASTCPDL